MTAALSRIAQSPLIPTTPPTRRHQPHLYHPHTTRTSLTQLQLTPRYPDYPETFAPRRPPYWNQRPTASGYKPPGANTTLLKSHEGKLWLGEKLEIAGEGNQVFKRHRGRGRGHGLKRGRRLRVGAVRLVSADGLSDRGRVEIFIRGEWGTVCDDLFTIRAGNVVCRQLGFTTALAVMKRAALGEADKSVKILLDDVECEGGERSLLECKRARVGKHDCSHGEDVGVICG